jgi:hypothetical protein
LHREGRIKWKPWSGGTLSALAGVIGGGRRRGRPAGSDPSTALEPRNSGRCRWRVGRGGGYGEEGPIENAGAQLEREIVADPGVAVSPRRSWIAAKPWPAIHPRFPAAPPTQVTGGGIYTPPYPSPPSIRRRGD